MSAHRLAGAAHGIGVIKMDALRQLNDPVLGKVGDDFLAQRLVGRPEVAEISPAVQEDRLRPTERAIASRR